MINRMITIDEELNKKLLGVNASELIRTLLVKHFEYVAQDDMSEEQIVKRLKVLKIEREAKEKIHELENN